MTIHCEGENSTDTISVYAHGGGFDNGRGRIMVRHNGWSPVYLDENHAQALVLALQAAIAEVQARAVSL